MTKDKKADKISALQRVLDAERHAFHLWVLRDQEADREGGRLSPSRELFWSRAMTRAWRRVVRASAQFSRIVKAEGTGRWGILPISLEEGRITL